MVSVRQGVKNIMVLAVLFSAVTLSGCATTYQPSISYTSDSFVRVQIQLGVFRVLGKDAKASIVKEAVRGCGIYGKTAVYLSTYCIANVIFEYCISKEFLYACK